MQKKKISDIFAIVIVWRILSLSWSAPVKLLPKEKSKQEGWTQQLSGAHTSWDTVCTKCQAERKKALSHGYRHQICPLPSGLYLLNRGDVSYHQRPFPDRSPLTVLYIHLAFNECLMSLKKSTLTFKRHSSHLNEWQGLVLGSSIQTLTGKCGVLHVCPYMSFF